MKACERADAILFGSMGLPDVRYPDGTEIAPQLDLRKHLELYAGVRPIRAIPGVPLPLADPRARDIDFVLVREQTEGWFYGRYNDSAAPPATDDVAYDIGRITRKGSERALRVLVPPRRSGASAAIPKKGRVTCVDKANVHRGFALFRKVFWEVAKRHPEHRRPTDAYVDAMALNLVRKPWDYDVLPTENQFGDILSDLGAGADRRDGARAVGRHRRQARALPAGGRHRARHRGQGHREPDRDVPLGGDDARVARRAARRARRRSRRRERIERAVDRAFGERKVLSVEFGGKDGTAAITRAVDRGDLSRR